MSRAVQETLKKTVEENLNLKQQLSLALGMTSTFSGGSEGLHIDGSSLQAKRSGRGIFAPSERKKMMAEAKQPEPRAGAISRLKYDKRYAGLTNVRRNLPEPEEDSADTVTAIGMVRKRKVDRKAPVWSEQALAEAMSRMNGRRDEHDDVADMDIKREPSETAGPSS